MPKKTPEPEQAPKADNYAKINMPAAFLTPHDIQTSDGRTFEKCFVSFPKGTKVNGIDVSGFSTDVFLSDYMKKDMLEKGRATVSFKKDEPVPIWTGKKDDAEHPYQRYEVKATDLTHALKVAQDSYKAEKAAERAAAKDGVTIWMQSGYRSVDYQKNLYDKKTQYFRNKGLSEAEAKKQAANIVNPPGYSEHNCGLAADLNSPEHTDLTEGFENTEAFRWLSAHAVEYGFILRYPKNAEAVTEITYEPWHWRYVGPENAALIQQSGLCFEDAVAVLQKLAAGEKITG